MSNFGELDASIVNQSNHVSISSVTILIARMITGWRDWQSQTKRKHLVSNGRKWTFSRDRHRSRCQRKGTKMVSIDGFQWLFCLFLTPGCYNLLCYSLQLVLWAVLGFRLIYGIWDGCQTIVWNQKYSICEFCFFRVKLEPISVILSLRH